MNPIAHSPVKEAMRKRNEQDARNEESRIRSKLAADIGKIVYKQNFSGNTATRMMIGFLIAGGVIGFQFHHTFIGIGAGLAAVWLVFIIMDMLVKNQNKEADAEKRRLEQAAEVEIRKAYEEADRRTVQQINAYDSEVKQYCQKVMQKADTISAMVQHNTDMFQRMVSHADAGSNIRFVETPFTYTVARTGILYAYQSQYTNPQDDFNFDKERFRNLNSDTECEGLAQALAKLTIRKMMSLYPPNSLHITVDHIDAKVTMHFKAANKNFVAARDIF